MNAYAFACWYQERTPLERRLPKSFDRHWRGIDELMAADEAEVDDLQCDPSPFDDRISQPSGYLSPVEFERKGD